MTSNLNKTSSPKKKYEVIIADTEAKSNGNNETKVRSRLNTSTAKTKPAKGDLNTADIAPAEAHPISKTLVF